MSESLTQRYDDLKKKLAEAGKDVDGEIKRLMGEGKAFSPAGALYALSREFEVEFGSPTTVSGVWLGGVPDSFGKTRRLILGKGGEVTELRDVQGDVQRFAVVSFEGARKARHKPSGREWMDASQAKATVTSEPSLDQLRAHAALPKQIIEDDKLMGVVGTVVMVATGNVYVDGKRTEEERALFFADKNGRERIHLKLMLLADGQTDTDPNQRVNVNLMVPQHLLDIYPEQLQNPQEFVRQLKEAKSRDPVYNAIGALTDEIIFAVGRSGRTMNDKEIKTPFINIDGGVVVNLGLEDAFKGKMAARGGMQIKKEAVGATLTGIDTTVFAAFEKNGGRMDGPALKAFAEQEKVALELVQDVIQRGYLSGKIKKDGKVFVLASI